MIKKIYLLFIISFIVNPLYSKDFYLEPYKTNYILPFSYKPGKTYYSYNLSDKYTNTEFEFQISLKYNFYNNLFNLNEKYYLSYTQKTFWQLYTDSSPFREINYNPELFVVFPFKRDIGCFHFKKFKASIVHNSNGRGNIIEINPQYYSSDIRYFQNSSRSHNYLEFSTLFEFHNIDVVSSFLINYLGKSDLYDNPDIYTYYGHFGLQFHYNLKDFDLSLKTHFNPIKLNGNLEFNIFHEVPHSDSLYIYFKYFHGYYESLIDYNNNVDKISVGLSFNLDKVF